MWALDSLASIQNYHGGHLIFACEYVCANNVDLFIEGVLYKMFNTKNAIRQCTSCSCR